MQMKTNTTEQMLWQNLHLCRCLSDDATEAIKRLREQQNPKYSIPSPAILDEYKHFDSVFSGRQSHLLIGNDETRHSSHESILMYETNILLFDCVAQGIEVEL